MRALVLALCLQAGCGPMLASRRADHKAPVAAYLFDMAVFSAGSIVGLIEFNKPGHNGDALRMYGGFGAALASWLPYWFVETR